MTPGDDDTKAPNTTPSDDAPVLRPTVFTPPAKPVRKQSRTAPASAPQTPTALKPTAIPGVERRRIEVTARDLKTLSPGVTPDVVKLALERLDKFVVEKVKERKAILWGHDLQQAHSDLVTATLAMSQSPLLKKVDGYLTRMIDILAGIDLKAICAERDGGLGQLFRSVNNKIDTAQELSAAQAELDQLVKYLGVALDDLLDLKEQLQQHSAAVRAIGVEVEASALAALFLSRHLQQNNSTVAERFTDRSISLTQTLAQIRSSDSLRTMQIEQPVRMVQAVQDVVLVMMPGFLGGVASALMLLDQKRLTPTQAGELNYQLRDILQQLRH